MLVLGRLVGPAYPLRYPQAGRLFPRQDTAPSRRADRTGRVCIGELHPLTCQPVNIRSLIKPAPETPNISPPQIINQKEDKVGLLARRASFLSRTRTPRHGDHRRTNAKPLQEITPVHNVTPCFKKFVLIRGLSYFCLPEYRQAISNIPFMH